jgi:hypothetical protein
VIGEHHGEADCQRRSRQCAGRAEENGSVLLVAKDAGKLRAKRLDQRGAAVEQNCAGLVRRSELSQADGGSALRLAAAAGRLPPPLVDSPKCTKRSLAGICLPDEVTFY